MRNSGIKERQLFCVVLFLPVHDGIWNVQYLDHRHFSVFQCDSWNLKLNVLNFALTLKIIEVNLTLKVFLLDNLIQTQPLPIRNFFCVLKVLKQVKNLKIQKGTTVGFFLHIFNIVLTNLFLCTLRLHYVWRKLFNLAA